MKKNSPLLLIGILVLVAQAGKVWVFLDGKDPVNTSQVQNGDYIDFLNKLPEDNIARRSKIDGEKYRISDLPVYSEYISAIEANGVKIFGHSRWLNAVVVDEGDIDRLKSLPFLLSTRPVHTFHRDLLKVHPEPLFRSFDTVHDLSYGVSQTQLEMLGVPEVHDMGLNGSGVLVCFMDGGFRLTHQVFLDVEIVETYDFVGDDSIVYYQDGDPTNVESHGTACWSVAAGAFPGTHYGPAFGARYLLARTEDVSGESVIEEYNWVAGVEWAESLGAEIVSTSLGYDDWYTCSDMNGDSAITTRAADYAASVGVLVINANGNSGSGACTIVAPADGDSVLSIGAVSESNAIAGFSSRGPTFDGRIKPDLVALGLSTRCATSLGDMEFGSKSGTSLAAPLISGIATLLLQVYPYLTPMEAISILKSTADKRHTPDNDYGWGLPNLNHAIRTDGNSRLLIPLKRGWNMISNPFSDNMNVDVTTFPTILGAAWSFNPSTNSYEEITELETARGCFLTSTKDTLIFIDGVFAEAVNLDVVSGWNMIGALGSVADSTEYNSSPEGAYMPDEIYRYHPGSSEYQFDNCLVPGEARWFLVSESATITIELETL